MQLTETLALISHIFGLAELMDIVLELVFLVCRVDKMEGICSSVIHGF